MLMAPIDIVKRIVQHESFPVRIALKEIVAGKESKDHQIRIVLQTELLQHDELFARLGAGIPGIDDFDLTRTLLCVECLLQQSDVIILNSAGPTERIAHE